MDVSDARERRNRGDLRRQEIVAALGQQALETDDIDRLMRDACTAVSDALDAEYCAVLELSSGDDAAVLRQGTGWRDGLIASETVPIDRVSPAGRTLQSDAPVVVTHLREEERFSAPELLASHDVLSVISATIGSADRRWGVLGAYATEPREFAEADGAFVQNVATILASAIQRRNYDRELDRASQRIEVALTQTGATVWEWDVERDGVTRHLDTLGLFPDGAETVDDFLAAVHPDDRASVHEAVMDAVDERSSYRVDFRFGSEDRRWAEGYGELSVPADGEEAPRMINVARDITTRKERERALEESERRYRTLAENFPRGAVGLFDRDLRYMAVGGELVEEVRGELGDPVGDSILERYPDDVVADLEPHVRAALAGEPGHCEVAFRGRHFLVHTLPVRNADDEVDAGMLVALDITGRREYQRRLEASHERLEEFASAVSHDLREPLGTIANYLRLLERRYEDELDEDAEEFIDFAVDGAERMREMIDGLVTAYARMETGQDGFEPVELDDVLANVRTDLQAKIADSDAEIAAEPLPRVVGDQAQLRQLLLNLLDNAIKYAGDDPPRIEIAARDDGEEWVIAVSDDGIGMDPDHAEDIFDVFQRLHPEDEYPGTGIGLALCQHIVERHDGEIWVETAPGEGSTFSFTLPAADREE